MNKQFFGTTYGGWAVDLDSIEDGDTIIDAGLGEDISFDEGLLEHKKVKIVGVDPTIKSHKFIEEKNNPNIELLKKAINNNNEKVKIYKNTNPNYVSESTNNTHHSVGQDFYEAESITISELIEKYNPSLIKLDIEGTEYEVLEECIGVKQVCVEFHHHCLSNRTYEQTMNLVNKFLHEGYRIIDNRNNYQELTFLKSDENDEKESSTPGSITIVNV